LAVDDNAATRDSLVMQIECWNMMADTAADGAAALTALRSASRAGRPFQIALIDDHMPGMNGTELARAIKAEAPIENTALILLSSIGQPVDVSTLRQFGFTGSMMKPVRQSQLFDAIVEAMARSDSKKPDAPVAENARPRPLAGVRVLLAEDNEVNQILASEVLKKAGC